MIENLDIENSLNYYIGLYGLQQGPTGSIGATNAFSYYKIDKDYPFLNINGSIISGISSVGNIGLCTQMIPVPRNFSNIFTVYLINKKLGDELIFGYKDNNNILVGFKLASTSNNFYYFSNGEWILSEYTYNIGDTFYIITKPSLTDEIDISCIFNDYILFNVLIQKIHPIEYIELVFEQEFIYDSETQILACNTPFI